MSEPGPGIAGTYDAIDQRLIDRTLNLLEIRDWRQWLAENGFTIHKYDESSNKATLCNALAGEIFILLYELEAHRLTWDDLPDEVKAFAVRATCAEHGTTPAESMLTICPWS